MLDITSLIIGVLLGSILDFILTLWIEWRGVQWTKIEFRKMDRKIDKIYTKLERLHRNSRK